MLRISHKITNNLLANVRYGLGFGKKEEKPKNDLAKYDVVIAGGHLGALLGRHLQTAMGPKAKVFVSYDKPGYELPSIRQFYQKGSMTKFQMQGSPKKSLARSVANSEGQGVAEYLPEKNQVVLKNGRNVQYDHLVVATGLKPQFNIPGLDEAWSDPLHPFFASYDHPSMRSTSSKAYRFIHNFQGGEAIFYIPPYPFHTEIQNYNFFVAKYIWDRNVSTGLISWANSRVTVINANDTFCQFYERGDSFIKSELERQKINAEYGWQLVEIKKNDRIAVFKNMKTGETQDRPYGNFYYFSQARPEDIIAKAGLADSNGLLDVDPYTLQHKKYSNIYGLGDVINTPTTKTFWAGFNQLHVVRNNLQRQLNGNSPNAKYDGLSEADILIEAQKAVKLSHFYGGKPNDSLSTGFMASLRYKWSKMHTKDIEKILSFKNWGPPYYKMKKNFSGSGDAPKSAVELHPEKKTA